MTQRQRDFAGVLGFAACHVPLFQSSGRQFFLSQMARNTAQAAQEAASHQHHPGSTALDVRFRTRPTTKTRTIRKADRRRPLPMPAELLKLVEESNQARLRYLQCITEEPRLELLLQRILDMAQPTLEARAKVDAMFGSIQTVLELSGEGLREAVGFDRSGKLVHCNGDRLKQITLRKSVQLVARMQAQYLSSREAVEDFASPARTRWMRLVAAAVK